MSIFTYDHSDGVDIYLFDDMTNHPVTGKGYGMASSVGGFPAKFLVTGTWDDGTPLVRSHVMTHEMGHVLSLWHTHHGTVFEAGDPPQCPECVDGSNSASCGDYITDTPADPNLNFNVDLSCNWLGSGLDSCWSVPYAPDI